MSSDPRPPSRPTRPQTERGRPPAHAFLIVDDEVDVLESLRHLFHRSYRVVTANSGDEAIAILNRSEVQIILSDQRMPGMSGDVFLSHARRLQPEAVRILFTGYADIQAVINAVNEGSIFRYILKPWDADDLEGVIAQAAERYDLLAERRRLLAELQAANDQLTKANRILAEAGQLKSSFIEVASHEFNTPITLVLGLSELLRLVNPNRPEQEQAIVSQIAASSKQLGRLVTNTLTLMRADDFRPGPLRSRGLSTSPSLLHRIVEKIEPFLKAREIRLVEAIDSNLGIFQADAEKIDASVINLLTNAIKFTPDRKQLTLSARLVDEGDAAEIVVEDTGIGLDARSLSHLFQPFFTEFDASRHSSGDFGFNKRGLDWA